MVGRVVVGGQAVGADLLGGGELQQRLHAEGEPREPDVVQRAAALPRGAAVAQAAEDEPEGVGSSSPPPAGAGRRAGAPGSPPGSGACARPGSAPPGGGARSRPFPRPGLRKREREATVKPETSAERAPIAARALELSLALGELTERLAQPL